MNRQHKQVKPKRDERFDQLIALANDGSEEAIHDLWTEYGYIYPATHEGAPNDAD